jgi:hypothetical protein
MIKGASAQEAWKGCLEDYQKTTDNIKWVAQNLPDDQALQKSAQCASPLQMGSYLHKIKKHQESGKTVGQAVMATLKDCEREAKKIHEASINAQLKTANKTACPACGCGCDSECKCPPGCDCKKDGGSCCKKQ